MYVVERWLSRMARSVYAEDFILKGGMLLASFGTRRPTMGPRGTRLEPRRANDRLGANRIRHRWSAPVMVSDGQLKKSEMENAI